MFNYVLTFATGMAAGVVLEKALSKMNANTIMGRAEALRACFGEPMCTTSLSLVEVKEWLNSRKELLEDGSKAIVVKANSENLKNLGKQLNIDGVDNYLVIAVVNQSQEIKEAVLIKYEKLEQNLEDILSKGNGSLVVEG